MGRHGLPTLQDVGLSLTAGLLSGHDGPLATVLPSPCWRAKLYRLFADEAIPLAGSIAHHRLLPVPHLPHGASPALAENVVAPFLLGVAPGLAVQPLGDPSILTVPHYRGCSRFRP